MKRRRWSRQALLVGMVALCTAPAPVARAADVDAILKRGTELRRQGRDAEALAEFQRAAALSDLPRAVAQVALAEQALGLWLDANAHLAAALERARDPWIAKNRKALESAALVIREHLCRFEVWGDPAGAQVTLDGKPAGVLPAVNVWLEPGQVELRASLDGFVSSEVTLKLPAAGTVREHVDLKRALALPAATAPLAVAETPESSGDGTAATLLSQPTSTDARDVQATGSHRWWIWTIVGAAVLTAGGTTAWLLTHRSNGCSSPSCTVW